jgi:hypothetical protein
MRLINLDVFDFKIRSNRFEMESEMLIKVGREGGEIISIPIKCIYHENRKSKIRPIADTIRFVRLIKEEFARQISDLWEEVT